MGALGHDEIDQDKFKSLLPAASRLLLQPSVAKSKDQRPSSSDRLSVVPAGEEEESRSTGDDDCFSRAKLGSSRPQFGTVDPLLSAAKREANGAMISNRFLESRKVSEPLYLFFFDFVILRS